MKLYRQLVVRLFKQADSQRFVLLLRRERMSAEMSLVWLTMSKALEGSIPMVSVQNEGEGWLKSWAVYYLCARGRRVETVECLVRKPWWMGETESVLSFYTFAFEGFNYASQP